MKGWKEKFEQALVRFAYGRNGWDELGFASTIAGFLVYLVGLFVQQFWLDIPAFALVLYGMFRMLSKNVDRRRSENAAFMRLLRRPRHQIALMRTRWQNRKTHRCYACKQCGQIVRVPKGKGKVSITCPRCKATFTKKT